MATIPSVQIKSENTRYDSAVKLTEIVVLATNRLFSAGVSSDSNNLD